MKNIILTFDYELFFQKSGTPQKCIINPVNDLINLFDTYNIKATFFVDTLYLERLKTENDYTKAQFSLIEKQLIELVKKGHRIELHLHPHWIDAVFNNNSKEWLFPNYKHYTLESLAINEIDEIFNTGINLLEEIAKKVDPKYKVIAYRAGGLCLNSFLILEKIFRKYNIKIDSSVSSGIEFKSNVHNNNFDNIPNKSIYKFNSDLGLEEIDGNYIEVPITSTKFNLKYKILKYFNNKIYNQRYYGDGYGIQVNQASNYLKKLFEKIFNNKKQLYSIDGYVYSGFEKIIAKEKKELITIIAHPKLLTKSSLDFIEFLSKKKYKFLTINDILR